MSDPTLSDQPAAAAPEAPKSLETLLNEAQAKIEEQRDAHLRALADADNARKRAQADIASAGKYAIERIVGDVLPVIDSLEAALATQPADAGPLRSGVELTLKQLRSALEKARVAEINPAPTDRFDPNRHQAMAAVEAPTGEMREPNTVVAVLQKGYLLHDRVVRPALVTVAKAVEKSTANPISNEDLQT
ncbi:MAG: nucleotide exchange factor GrpE [Betaproteobacteria bacterium]|nr:nucleotide exchange factor GrpE [Betaproteobacteria bacterium]